MEVSWHKNDFECRLGFHSKKYTGSNTFLSFLLGGALSVFFYAILLFFHSRYSFTLVDMFFHGGAYQRSIVPYFIVFFSFWTLAMIFIKYQKIKLQEKVLYINLVPEDDDYILSPANAGEIIGKMHTKVDNPKKFLLLNRLERALANLKNIGRISDVAETLDSQAGIDEQYVESTYTLSKGFIWAIPVMGFIGTVLGLSQAIGGFGKVLTGDFSPDKLKGSLIGVTGGLAVAFETTLIALVAALFIQIVMTFVSKREEDFLDECSDYCHRNIVARLKTIGTEKEIFEN